MPPDQGITDFLKLISPCAENIRPYEEGCFPFDILSSPRHQFLILIFLPPTVSFTENSIKKRLELNRDKTELNYSAINSNNRATASAPGSM